MFSFEDSDKIERTFLLVAFFGVALLAGTIIYSFIFLSWR